MKPRNLTDSCEHTVLFVGMERGGGVYWNGEAWLKQVHVQHSPRARGAVGSHSDAGW